MAIVGGLDLHRAQITYDYLNTATGEIATGCIRSACRETFAAFLAELPTRDADFVVEGCTGWWYVADELERAGMRPHVADPAEAAALKSPKRRAKTDRTDARHLRQLFVDDRVPESWIPPAHVVETKALIALYMDLSRTRVAWAQRVHATLFHHGAPPIGGDLNIERYQREALEHAQSLPGANRHAVQIAVEQIRLLTGELTPIHRQLVWIGRHQPAAKAIQAIYGVGALAGPVVWAELGDVRRFRSSRQVIRHCGLDITVHESDGKRSRGHLSRQGPGALRWILFESGKVASHRAAPDHSYYVQVKKRSGHNIATLSVARKIARRCFHILVAAGDDILAEPTSRRPRPQLGRAA